MGTQGVGGRRGGERPLLWMQGGVLPREQAPRMSARKCHETFGILRHQKGQPGGWGGDDRGFMWVWNPWVSPSLPTMSFSPGEGECWRIWKAQGGLGDLSSQEV